MSIHCSFRRACSRSYSASTPSSKVAEAQKSYALWLGKHVITSVHIVSLSDGQVRTVTRLVREEQLNVTEFKKFKVAAHESSINYQENSYDRMFFGNWFRSFCINLRTRSSMNHQKWKLKLFTLQVFFQNQQLLQPRERLHNHLQQNLQSMFRFNRRQDYLNLNLQNQAEESQGKKTVRPIRIEVNLLTSHKEGVLEINEKPINSDLEEADQEPQQLQDLKLQEWYQGDLQGYSEKEASLLQGTQSKKPRMPSKRSSHPSIAQVTKYMIQFLSDSCQMKIEQKSLNRDGSLDLVQVTEVFSGLTSLGGISLKPLTKRRSMLIVLR